MDAVLGRGHVKTTLNPDERLDYGVTLTGRFGFPAGLGSCQISIRCTPDNLIISQSSCAVYLSALDGMEWAKLDEAATAILEDMGNEMVARWIQVKASMSDDDTPSTRSHQIVMEDKQPQWENASLLARIAAI